MHWKSVPFEHYDVTRFDGAVKTFLPCDSPAVWCYLTDVRNPQGQELKFERGDHRRLMRLVSPNGSWIRVDYDAMGRIAEVTDSNGRTVKYGYDMANRLTDVIYPSGEACHYEYDSTQHLLTFSASPGSTTPARVLMRNEYSNGLLVKQTLADGSVYAYSYNSADVNKIRSAIVHAPDGKIFNLIITQWLSTVHEQ
jgi:YD repeat-containing protein